MQLYLPAEPRALSAPAARQVSVLGVGRRALGAGHWARGGSALASCSARLAEDGDVANKAKREAQLSHKPRSARSDIGW